MGQKYYAVREGKKIGIFTTWNETQKYVLGYPNAVYKSFTSLVDAEKFLNFKEQNSTDISLESREVVQAYVDVRLDHISVYYLDAENNSYRNILENS